MHPCSVVEMRSDLSISPTNMDRTGIVRFGIVWNGMEWYLKWQHMVWCGMVQCTTGGFGMVMDKTDTQEAALAAAACSQFCAIARLFNRGICICRSNLPR